MLAREVALRLPIGQDPDHYVRVKPRLSTRCDLGFCVIVETTRRHISLKVTVALTGMRSQFGSISSLCERRMEG